MKCALLIMFMVVAFHVSSQNNAHTGAYYCQDGKTHFYASTPLEDISPVSHSTLCVLNTGTGKVYAKVPLKSFTFKNGLMQEHFNENFVESDKYPSATLEARIVEHLDYSKDGIYNVTLKGTFEMHGVKKEIEIKGKLTVKNAQPVLAEAAFEVKPADFNIKIPTAVVVKIAEVVKVDVELNLKKYEK